MKSALPLLLLAACSGNDEAAPAKHQAQPAITFGSGAPPPPPPGVDPSAVHLDDYGSTVRPVAPQPLPGRERRAIDVTLRSSPPGALAAVDGTPIGNTPAFWSGFADGREHQFVFTLPGHAIARYRFVPVSSGVIHARLDPIAEDRTDAGVPPPEVVAHPPASVVVPPAPPPTIVAPDAAVVAPPVGSGSSLAPTTNGPPVGPQP